MRLFVWVGMSLVIAVLWAPVASAHCDTLNGPVVSAAREALAKGDVTPVLKWVRQEHEAEIREAFQKTLAVRAKGPEARELADAYFFETLVRVHRQGEGTPYTGLKAEGSEAGPGVEAADTALEKASVDSLVQQVQAAAAEGIRARFQEAIESRKHAGSNVVAGRAYVAAYVEFIHYIERLYADAAGPAHHHHED